MLADGLVGGGPRTPALPVPTGRRTLALRPNLSLTVGVARTVEGTALLSASAGDVCLRKVVHPDGSFHAQVDHCRDRLALAAFDGRLSLTYGSRSIVLTQGSCRDEDWRGARELMLAAPAARMFRRLASELEATGYLDLELLGLRTTGALLGEVDGDEGAVRRLGRTLIARQAAEDRRVGRGEAGTVAGLERLLSTTFEASAELERRVIQSGVWGADRIGPQLAWVLRLEAAWFDVTMQDPRVRPSGGRADRVREGASC